MPIDCSRVREVVGTLGSELKRVNPLFSLINVVMHPGNLNVLSLSQVPNRCRDLVKTSITHFYVVPFAQLCSDSK